MFLSVGRKSLPDILSIVEFIREKRGEEEWETGDGQESAGGGGAVGLGGGVIRRGETDPTERNNTICLYILYI